MVKLPTFQHSYLPPLIVASAVQQQEGQLIRLILLNWRRVFHDPGEIELTSAGLRSRFVDRGGKHPESADGSGRRVQYSGILPDP